MVKKNHINFLLCCLTIFLNQLGAQQKLEEIIDFGYNPGRLRMFNYVPNEPISNAPLIIILHGCSQQAQDIAELTGWNKIADETKSILIYPQQRAVNNPSHCFRWFSEHQNKRNNGEVASIHAMVRHMIQKGSIDTSRIFITGFSAGAAMSVSMLVNYPELFSAGAAFAGGAFGLINNLGQSADLMTARIMTNDSLLLNGIKKSNHPYKTKYPTLFTYHGTADPVVNYKNAGILHQQWALLHDCDTSTMTVNTAFQGNEFVDTFTCYNLEEQIVFRHYRLNGGKHQVPIITEQGGKTGIFTINKGFHSTKQVAIDFGLYELQKE